MPLYEYQCRECGVTFEHLIGIAEPGLIECTSCGSTRMEKVLSPTALLTKMPKQAPGKTCCGADERCATPPCGSGGGSCCES